jgi:hypothetical protein
LITRLTYLNDFCPLVSWEDAYWTSAQPDLRSVIDTVTDGKATYTITSTAALLNATPTTHAAVEQIWPSFACITQTRDSAVNDQNLRTCQAEVTKFLRKRWDSWPGPMNLGSQRCRQTK